MTRLRVLGSRLVALFFRRRRDRELDDEIQAHLNALTDDYVRGGMPLAEARDAARREFGGLEQMKDTYRDQRGVPPVETIVQDLRYGARMLRRSPGFTAVAVLSLGLGIGANTAVFAFLNALLLRSLPVPHPEELVEVAAQRRGDFAPLSYPIYRDLRARQQVFTDVFASAGETPYRLTIRQASGGSTVLDNMRVAFVSGNYFAVLGLQPAIGRLIAETDDLDPGSSETVGSVIVISDGFWQRQFGRDPGVLGGSILVGRSRCTIIGVAPGQFLGESVGAAAVGWVPLVPFSDRSDLENRREVFADYVARLRPGMSRERAQTEATGLFRQVLAGEDGLLGSISDYTISLRPAGTGTDLGLRRQFAMPFRIVMGVVSLVLLIACANVANLLLERAMSRRGEISVRLAIGCSRARLVRQLMTESALLSTLGALAGATLAYGGSRLLPRLIDSGAVPVRLDVSPDSYVLMFLVAISLLAGLGFGLVPAFRSTRVNVAASLQRARRGDGRSPGGRVSRALVVAQIAVSLVLLVTAALLIRSLANLHDVDYGFHPGQVVIFDLAGLPPANEPAALAEQARRVYQDVSRIPGVRSASVSSVLLFSPTDGAVPLTIPGYTPTPEERPATARWISVSTGYLETIGMTLVAGRSLGEQDRLGGPLVAVVNESLARRYFPGRAAVGGIVAIDRQRAATRTPGASTGAFGKPVQIVGVVHDAKYNNLREEARPMIYFSIEQFPRNIRSLEVRSDRPVSAIFGPVRDALAGASRDLMIRRAVTLSDQVDQTLAAERLVMRLCSLFGGLALLLASVGLYGVLAYAVAQRTGEIGIRMALGATAHSIRRLVFGETLILVFIGLAIGLLLTVASTRLVAGLLFGLTPTDPAVIIAAVAVLAGAAAMAAHVPVRRAVRVDPLVALRHE